MDSIALVSICFLCVFLFRDAQLLNASPSSPAGSPLPIYAMVILASILAASGLHATTPVQIVNDLRSPWIWGISIGLHVAGLGFCIWFRRLHILNWSWLIAVFPSPILALVLLGISTDLSSPRLGSIGAASVVTIAWTVVVGATGALLNRIGGSDSEFAVDFAAVSNSTAFALLPLAPFF